MLPNSHAQLALRRPADGPLSRVGIVRYRTWLIAQLAGIGAPAFVEVGGGFGPSGGAHSDGAPWVSPVYAQNHSTALVRLFCSAGAPGNCVFHSATPLQARGIEVDLYEEVPPSGSIDGGSLISGGVQRANRWLTYSATDQESGVARVDVLLDDAVVAVDDAAGDPESCPRTGFNACRGTRSRDLRINTQTVPDGQHRLALRVTDAAGNRRVVSGPFVYVENGAQAMNAGEAVSLSAYFAQSGRTQLTTRFGRRVWIRGRLLKKDGRPIGQARIDLDRRVVLAGSISTHDDTRTDGEGRFRYLLPRRTSSIFLRVSYPTSLTDATSRVTKRLTLKVKAAASLRVTLRGIMVRYAGRVLTRPLPKGGKLVLMQGRAQGGVWQTFATRRTRRGGGFSGRYRLRVHRQGVRLQFRVRLPRQHGYPFAAGLGGVITRTVR